MTNMLSNFLRLGNILDRYALVVDVVLSLVAAAVLVHTRMRITAYHTTVSRGCNVVH